MAPPPSKRQKRSVVLSSDDDEENMPAAPATNITFKGQPATRSRTKPIKTTENPSPKKPARPSRAATQRQGSASISSFFHAAKQAQTLPERDSPLTASPELADEVEDQIEDVSSDDDDIGVLRRQQSTSRAVLDRRKKPDGDGLSKGSRKFKITGNKAIKNEEVPLLRQQQDSRPWAERFGPEDLNELVVHKKKVSDVREWLDGVFQGRLRKRLLVLKGPTGTGKTATISVLAKAMDLEISEWRNPVGSEYSPEGYLSMSAQFEEFLGRSGKFSGLDLSDNSRKPPSSSPSGPEQKIRKKIVLLEEFPNTLLSTSSALRSFRSSILYYLAANTPTMESMPTNIPHDKATPLIMAISETRLTTTSSASDSFTIHRLLGPDILGHPGVSVIEFNPVAPTLLTRALDLVIRKEARRSERRRIPGPSILKTLSEVGDVRSAIGSLEFLCLRGEDDDDWGGRVDSSAREGAKSASIATKMEKDSLEMVTRRESTLGLFHAVGKVVYNKRDNPTEAPTHTPYHLSNKSRPRVSQVSVENLIDETGTDIGTFIAALHENYVLSCEGPLFVDTVNSCLDSLSDSDVLGSPRGGKAGLSGQYGSCSFQGSASDSLRQDEICFQLAVRGLLFALPDPVKRRAHPVAGKGGGKNDTYKMFYPTSMRLSKQVEELEDHLDQWTNSLRIHLATWTRSTSTHYNPLASSHSKPKQPLPNHPQPPNQDEIEPVRTHLHSTKIELILERLPYIAKIETRNPASSSTKDLERITQFHGVKASIDEPVENDDADAAPLTADWTTDRPADAQSEGPMSVKSGVGQAGKADGSVLPAVEEVEKMFLSDDDIED